MLGLYYVGVQEAPAMEAITQINIFGPGQNFNFYCCCQSETHKLEVLAFHVLGEWRGIDLKCLKINDYRGLLIIISVEGMTQKIVYHGGIVQLSTKFQEDLLSHSR